MSGARVFSKKISRHALMPHYPFELWVNEAKGIYPICTCMYRTSESRRSERDRDRDPCRQTGKSPKKIR